MIKPKKHPREEERLTVLHRYGILDTMAEQAYDDITKIASAICGTSIAVISFVDKDRQWFKSTIGLDAKETPKDVAFCAHAILESSTFVVNDATRDPRFVNNPLVTSEPHIRFYAGAPLKSLEGLNLGTICVIDQKPMQITPEQAEVLQSLSRQVMMLLELRYNLLKMNLVSHELKEANDKINQLVGVVAHDLKNPLGNIYSLTELIEDETSREELDEYIRLIKLSSSNSLEMVQNILEMSAIESGKIQIQKTPQSIHELLKESWNMVAHLARKKAITHVIQGDDAEVSVDRQRIIQTFCNLLTNAIKFSHHGSTINLSIVTEAEKLSLSIKDHGVGMSEAQMKNLFDPTKATSTKGTSGESGTGYGLPLVAQIISLHEGTIDVLSEVGVGTTFVIKLPLKA